MKVTGTLKMPLNEKGFTFASAVVDGEYRDVFLHVSSVPEHMQEQLFLVGASVTGTVRKTFHKGAIKYAFERVSKVEFLTCLARVKWFDPKKGYGMAHALDGEFAEQDVFVHHTVAKQCGLDLQPGMPLRMCLQQQKDGRLNATRAETSPTILEAVQQLTDDTTDLSDVQMGVVKWFDPKKGYGFVILEDDETGEKTDHFLTAATLEVYNLKPQDLQPYDVVEVKTFINQRGKSQVGSIRRTGENIAPEPERWYQGTLLRYNRRTGKGVVQLEWEDDGTSEHSFDSTILVDGLDKSSLTKGDVVIVMINEDEDDEPVTALRLPEADTASTVVQLPQAVKS